MKFKKTWLVVILACVVTLVACGEKSGNVDSNASTTTNGVVNNEKSDGNESPVPADYDPFGKYDPVIELKTVKGTAAWATFPEGETWDNENRWYKLIKDTLGIDIQYDWLVDSSQYNTKINVTIASNDIPDLMNVSRSQLTQLVEADMIEDLTDVFDAYALPFLKEQVETGLRPSQEMATYNGRLMAIPQYSGDPRDQVVSLYVRTDWLENLNLPEPTTFEELIQVAEAFANDDPDQNGQDDTFGLGILSATLGGGSMGGFMNSFHAYPDIWIDDGSGNLVFGSVQPEVKEALSQLREMYQDGVIDREFATKDYNQLKEDVVSEKVGMFYGTVSESALILADQKKNNMSAKWKALPLPSIDGNKARPHANISVGGFYVVKKGYSHPEAAVKLMNLFIQQVYGEDGAGKNMVDNMYAWVDAAKYAMHVLSPVEGYVSDSNYMAVIEAIKNEDPSGLSETNRSVYEIVTNTDGSDPEDWQQWWIHQEDLSPFRVREDYKNDPDGVVISAFYGGSTPTADAHMSTLDTMKEETFARIIMGEAGIDEFDSFVEDWYRLGGEKITQEVNEWKQQSE